MKKLFFALIAALLAVCTLFAFAACGGGTGNESPVHKHVWTQTWTKDEAHHWHECTAADCTVTENSEKDSYAAHDFSNGDCICGEQKPHKHVWAKAWTKDEAHHWHECTAADCTVSDNSKKNGYAAHNLSNGDCVCGEKNPHKHVWAQTWTKGETHHWHECTVDGCYVTQNSNKNGYAAHNTSGDGGTCSVCGWLTPTKGLKYAPNADGKSYYCAGIGTATDTNIVIAEAYNGLPVTTINSSAFYNCTSLRNITIPNSVTSIGWEAFYHCTNLRSVTIPSSVTEIKNYTFQHCTSLKSVTIPDSVTSIGREAFYNCTDLTDVTVPGSVSVIGYAAFEDCTSLTNITIENGVKKIEQNAFRACKKITSISIPKSVTEIGMAAFYNCTSITGITIPSGVTSISDWAFRYCTSLKSVTIENGVTKIGEYAFGGCKSLSSITIPVSLTEIGKDAFGCNEVGNITFGGTIEQWGAIKKGAYWHNFIRYTVHCTDGNI